MSIHNAVSRLIKRLGASGDLFNFHVYGKALFDGLAEEFNRVNTLKDRVKNSTVANVNIDSFAIEDYETRYGVDGIGMLTDDERIQKILARASENGSGGPDWLEQIIRDSGYDLYVIVNQPDSESSVPQFGTDFQFSDVQFGGLVSYIDTRNVSGELITSSPVTDIGGLSENFGPDIQFGPDFQFGTLLSGFSYPRPKPFVLPSDPDRWGYVFFVSPFEDRLATDLELLQLPEEEFNYLVKLILKSKFTRNWCILQAEIA